MCALRSWYLERFSCPCGDCGVTVWRTATFSQKKKQRRFFTKACIGMNDEVEAWWLERLSCGALARQSWVCYIKQAPSIKQRLSPEASHVLHYPAGKKQLKRGHLRKRQRVNTRHGPQQRLARKVATFSQQTARSESGYLLKS